jgi:hypothetical protein
MRPIGFALALLLGATPGGDAPKPEPINLRVLYVGPASTPRGQAYARFLRQHFRAAEAVERKGFDPRHAAPFDVVLLDWSQSQRPSEPMSPLGPIEAWDKPTVLLGSAGLLLAEAWNVHGTIG